MFCYGIRWWWGNYGTDSWWRLFRAGLCSWKITGSQDITLETARSYALGETLASGACLIATLTGVMNVGGWLLVFAYAFFASGFVVVAIIFKREETSSVISSFETAE